MQYELHSIHVCTNSRRHTDTLAISEDTHKCTNIHIASRTCTQVITFLHMCTLHLHSHLHTHITKHKKCFHTLTIVRLTPHAHNMLILSPSTGKPQNTHTLKQAQLSPLLGLQKVFFPSLWLIRPCSRGQAVANNRY